MQTTISWKLVQTTIKGSSKLTKKITHVDDMMIYNLVKYLVQTRLHLWNIKITNFKPERKMSRWFVRNLLFLYLTNEVEFGQDILQDCVLSYHLYVDFFGEFRRLFYRGLHGFSRRLWFPSDMFPRYGLTLIYLCIY